MPLADREARLKYWRDYRKKNMAKKARQDAEYRATHRREIHDRHMKLIYGLGRPEFDALLIAQSGRCDSCGDPLSKCSIDHDHLTGRVRALLCNHCNCAVGQVRESPARARAVADYLERHSYA